ncbi:MFS general substrate transporter [Cubamyces sp. BRFM 1775]|nr:MFS general substrate transporter [Cubamyces sp. BRFM 1775]
MHAPRSLRSSVPDRIPGSSSLRPSTSTARESADTDAPMLKTSLEKCDETVDVTAANPRNDIEERPSSPSPDGDSLTTYRLYKRRWIGLSALVLLNIASGMVLVWFGPIANDMVRDFGFTLSEVNWLGNVSNVVYLPFSIIVPYLYGRLGIRGTCYIGAILFVVSGWVRYAGTKDSLSEGASYTLMVVGQVLAGIAVPIFQIVIPSYSQKWFDLKGRTTATMIMGIANPVGNALGQLIPPLVPTPKDSLLVMAIIFTAVTPAVFLVGNAPPTPPTFAGSQKHPSLGSLLRAMAGKASRDEYTYMTMRQRIDFAIVAVTFGVLVGVFVIFNHTELKPKAYYLPTSSINAFTILSAQHFEPYGYSDTVSGLMGAILLLVGLIAAAITSPIYDRVLTHHLALSCKVLCPILGACWIALIWEIKPHNTAVCFVLMGLIGGTGLTLLPAVIELAVELTRNADGSSAMLWSSTNLFGLVFVLAENALRAGPDASPPLNMRRARIFQASLVAAVITFVYLIEGKQTRREQDEERRAASGHPPRSPDRTIAEARDADPEKRADEAETRVAADTGAAADMVEDKKRGDPRTVV